MALARPELPATRARSSLVASSLPAAARAIGRPAVINVSSGLGSFALTHDPERVESTTIAPLYLASKSPVTMLTMHYAKALPW
jgi:NAD(P)-dependent dehydrogenase (short-subunit alcohol dehydrogenase family)